MDLILVDQSFQVWSVLDLSRSVFSMNGFFSMGMNIIFFGKVFGHVWQSTPLKFPHHLLPQAYTPHFGPELLPLCPTPVFVQESCFVLDLDKSQKTQKSKVECTDTAIVYHSLLPWYHLDIMVLVQKKSEKHWHSSFMLRANKILTFFPNRFWEAVLLPCAVVVVRLAWIFRQWICHGSIRCWMFWSICTLAS